VIFKLTWISFQFSFKLSWCNINNLKNIYFKTNKSLLNSSYACRVIKSLRRSTCWDLELVQIGANRCTVPSSGSLLHNLVFWAHCTWKLLKAGHSVLSVIHCPGRQGRYYIGVLWNKSSTPQQIVGSTLEQRVTMIKPCLLVVQLP
jgi:hypothetical protein